MVRCSTLNTLSPWENATVVAASSTVGYVVSGLTHGSLLPGFASGLIFMVVTMLVLRQRNKQKDAAQA